MRYLIVLFGLGLGTAVLAQNTQKQIDSLRNVLDSVEGQKRIQAEHNLATLLVTINADEADSLSQSALTKSKELEYDEGIVLSSIVQATLANLRSELNKSEKILRETLELAKEMKFVSALSKVHTALGSLYIRKGEYTKAIEHHLEGVKAAQELGQHDVQLTNLMNIGLINQRIGNLDEADRYLREALEIGKGHDLQFRVGQLYINLGVMEFGRKNVGLSIDYNQKALAVFQSFGDVSQQAICYQNLGFAEASLGNFREAKEYYDRTVEIRKEIKDYRGLAAVLLNKAKLQRSMENQRVSISLAEEALHNALLINNSRLIQSISQFLSEGYEGIGNSKKALEHFKTYNAVKDSLTEASNSSRIAQLTSEFEFEQKEQELKNRQEELARLTNQRWILTLIILVLVVLTILIVVAYRMRLAKVRVEQKLSAEEKKSLDLQRQSLSLDLELQSMELKAFAEQLIQKNELIGQIKDELEGLKSLKMNAESNPDLTNLAIGIEGRSSTSITLEEFRVKFNQVYEQFIPKLIETHGHLTQNELDLCIFFKVNLTYKDIAQIQNISYEGVKKAVQRLYKKFDRPTAEDLRLYLLSF